MSTYIFYIRQQPHRNNNIKSNDTVPTKCATRCSTSSSSSSCHSVTTTLIFHWTELGIYGTGEIRLMLYQRRRTVGRELYRCCCKPQWLKLGQRVYLHITYTYLQFKPDPPPPPRQKHMCSRGNLWMKNVYTTRTPTPTHTFYWKRLSTVFAAATCSSCHHPLEPCPGPLML